MKTPHVIENAPDLELKVILRTDELAAAIKAFDWDFINPLLGTDLIPIKSAVALELLELAVLEKNFPQVLNLITKGVRIPKQSSFSCEIGSKYDVLNERNQWLEAEVIAVQEHSVTVQFIGLPSKWNEVINIKTSSNRFSPFGIRSSGNVPIKSKIINWSILFECLFLHAKTEVEWDFVIEHFSEITDNFSDYVKELLFDALSSAATDQQIETILQTDDKNFDEYFCANAAFKSRWYFVDKYLALNELTSILHNSLVEWPFRNRNFLKAKEMFLLNNKIEIIEGISFSLHHVETLANADSLDDWRFAWQYLEKFKSRKINLSAVLNLVESALTTSANDEVISNLIKFGFPVNKAVLHAANKNNKLGWLQYLTNDSLEKIVEMVSFDQERIVKYLMQLPSHKKNLLQRMRSELKVSVEFKNLQSVIAIYNLGFEIYQMRYCLVDLDYKFDIFSDQNYGLLKSRYDDCFKDMLAKAQTPEEWFFVCKAIKMIDILDQDHATKILNAAIKSNASETTIASLLQTNAVVNLEGIQLAIKNNNINWIIQLDLRKFTDMLVRFSQADQWEVLKICYNIYPVSISRDIAEKLIASALRYYSISGLVICEEIGINLGRNINWNELVPDRAGKYVPRVLAQEFLYSIFRKASLPHFEFVFKNTHLIKMSATEKDLYYYSLISTAIEANASDEMLIKIANLAAPLTSVMLASCFAAENSHALSVMLTEDRDVSNEKELEKSVSQEKNLHVIAYLRLRAPSLSALKNMFESISGYQDIESAKSMLKSIMELVRNKSDLAKAIDEFSMSSSKLSRFIFFLDPIHATDIFLKKTYQLAVAKFDYETMLSVVQKYPLSDQNKTPEATKLVEKVLQYCNRTLSAGIVKQSTRLPLLSLFRTSLTSVDTDLHYKFLAAANFIFLKLTGVGCLSAIDKHELAKGELKDIVGEVRLTDELMQGEYRTRLSF